MTKDIFLIALSIFFFTLSTWLFFSMFIEPLLIDDVSLVSADPLYFMSLIFGSSMGLFMLAPFNVASRLLRNQELKLKTLVALSVFIGFLGVGLNIAIYEYVIEPNELIKCPSKVGYKKNLLGDYVKDINQCDKF